MRLCPFLRFAMLFMFMVTTAYVAGAQTSPPDGIRNNTPTVHAFINVRVVQSPAKTVDNATLVIRDGIIESVGNSSPPKDARVWDLKGMTIYPGLIDGYSDYGMEGAQKPGNERSGREEERKESKSRGPAYWNDHVQSQNNAADMFLPDEKSAEKLRSQGFTSALVVSPKGIFRGTSALVDLGAGKPNELIVKPVVAQHIQLSQESGGDDYPGSLMGVIALIRQTFYDADWYRKAQAAFDNDPALPRPETNEALAALRDALSGNLPVIIEASDELNFLRADAIAKEFGLKLIVRGSGNEYKRIDAVKATRRPVILPVNFPDVPSVQSLEEALQISLAELRYWDEAPENPARLKKAGVEFALTAATLKDAGSFLSHVRKAVERGLSSEAALAALTVTPAQLCGVVKQLGTLEPGKQANFIITDGDLFAEKTKIRESWIEGKRYEITPLPEIDPRGMWSLTIPDTPDSVVVDIKGEPDGLKGTIKRKKEVKLTTVSFAAMRLSFTFRGDSVGYDGIVRMSATVGAHSLSGTGEWADGESFAWSGTRIAPYVPEPDTAKSKEGEPASFTSVFPPGAFGREKIPAQPDAVFVKNATVWTSGPQGKLENADLLIEKGKIARVGKGLGVPSGAIVIDATEKNVTPGIIDCHSHMAVSGSVNEAGQAISAEVRIGDVIDCDDIDIYRALAGGVTGEHVLHGSANPIGGQCQLIKLRWGMLPEEMKFNGAPPTIKFALGENVKQSNWGDRFTTRYPQTRMGVEEIIRDEFQAARDYEKTWKRYEAEQSGIPPRRDLELDAIVEVLNGKRLVHCHSYRQDEILMLMRLAEEFGFRIRTFQHILEGYKVADVMAKHGAGGSTFSDWWAYKLEVYDAIPYNGALMHDQGVLVSFNSDSDELTRRLNTEAAKAVKYGGLSEEEALKFVTINPAKQLKVDGKVGSLEAGKDADFVIWSGNPLSTYSICEQTWIEGRKFFDISEDKQMREEVRRERAVLIQKALAEKKKGPPDSSKKPGRKGGEEL